MWWWSRQKVVSKAEGRFRRLSEVTSRSAEAGERIAPLLIAAPDPRFVQIVLDEERGVVRSERISSRRRAPRVHLGNAPRDHVQRSRAMTVVTLLPEDPDASAPPCLPESCKSWPVRMSAWSSPTHSARPWRLGIVNVALWAGGLAGGP